jgi:hypothetical protein
MFPLRRTRLIVFVSLTLAVLCTATTLQAGSATWKTTAVSGNWNSTSNWTPATIPNGPLDVASFGTTNRTAIAFSTNTEVNALMFNAGASAYTITAGGTGANFTFTISGAGITNSSAALQNFVAGRDENFNQAHIIFTNSAAAGSNTRFVTNGGTTEFHNTSTAGSAVLINTLGGTTFSNSSTASNAMITNEGSADSFFSGGFTNFENSATAGNAVVVNNAAQSSGVDAGHMQFSDMANAGNATFTNKGTFSGAGSGNIYFDGNSSAGNADFTNEATSSAGFGPGGFIGFLSHSTAASSTIRNNGGTTTGARGGRTEFFSASTAGASTVIANGGAGGGDGGRIFFQDSSTGGTSQIRVFGNSNLNIDAHNDPGVNIGSLEGTGNVFVGPRTLTVGSNNLDTAFSGFIDDSGMGGGFTKTGTGVLSLGNGANNMVNNGLADTLSLSVAAASTINLNYTGPPDSIRSLILGGVSQVPGIYGSAASGAPHPVSQFTGAGKVQVMMQAVSRKTHGAATFDIDLPLIGTPQVECRSGGASNNYQIVAMFLTAVTFNSASVTSGNGMVSNATGSGTTSITANLTGITNAQTIHVTFFGVNDGTGAHDITIPMAILIGDTTGNGTVTSSDVSQVKLQSGQPVTSSNFRADINASGTITSTDISSVKLKTGTALP